METDHGPACAGGEGTCLERNAVQIVLVGIFDADADNIARIQSARIAQLHFTVDLGRLSAASALVLIPSITLFVILRRNFVQGVASTGLKE